MSFIQLESCNGGCSGHGASRPQRQLNYECKAAARWWWQVATQKCRRGDAGMKPPTLCAGAFELCEFMPFSDCCNHN